MLARRGDHFHVGESVKIDSRLEVEEAVQHVRKIKIIATRQLGYSGGLKTRVVSNLVSRVEEAR